MVYFSTKIGLLKSYFLERILWNPSTVHKQSRVTKILYFMGFMSKLRGELRFLTCGMIKVAPRMKPEPTMYYIVHTASR